MLIIQSSSCSKGFGAFIAYLLRFFRLASNINTGVSVHSLIHIDLNNPLFDQPRSMKSQERFIDISSVTSLLDDREMNDQYKSLSESASNRFSKQSAISLNSALRLPSTPARKTSDFFDSIGNLDPLKYSPQDCQRVPKTFNMSEKYVAPFIHPYVIRVFINNMLSIKDTPHIPHSPS